MLVAKLLGDRLPRLANPLVLAHGKQMPAQAARHCAGRVVQLVVSIERQFLFKEFVDFFDNDQFERRECEAGSRGELFLFGISKSGIQFLDDELAFGQFAIGKWDDTVYSRALKVWRKSIVRVEESSKKVLGCG